MIRKCEENDYENILELIKKEAEFNLFIIADIENHGVSTDFLDIWGNFNKDGVLDYILLKFYSNYIIYTYRIKSIPKLVNNFVKIINDNNDLKVLSGKKEIIDLYSNSFDFREIRDKYFLNLDIKNFKPIDSCYIETEIATLDDIEAIFELRKKIKEFGLVDSIEGLKRRMKTNMGRTYIIKDKGKVISAASTTAESSFSAMIGGVMTDPDYRMQGYASFLISELSGDLLKENKTPCLFYDNPRAGSIYKKLGFQELGMWTLCVK